jgi:arylformamidase
VKEFMSHEASKEKYADGVTFQIGSIAMVANTGTAIDAPSHRYEHADDVSALPLKATANLDAIVARLTGHCHTDQE